MKTGQRDKNNDKRERKPEETRLKIDRYKKE